MRLKEIQLNSKELRDYIDLVGYEKDQTLDDLREVTRSLGDASIMQIGSSQGKLIEIICRLGNFSKCIEIGVFTGYSSICTSPYFNLSIIIFSLAIKLVFIKLKNNINK